MEPVALKPLTAVSPERITGAALMGVAVATSPPVLGVFARETSVFGWCGMLLYTAMMTVPLRMWAVGARESHDALARVLIGGFLAGWANSVLCFVVAAAAPLGPWWQALFAAPVVALFGIPIGGPVGVGYGILFVAPVLLANAYRRRPTPDRADKCLLGVSVWAAMVALGAGLVADLDIALALPVGIRWFVVAALVLVGVAAVVLGALALARLVQRRRWLRRVRAGGVPDWTVVPIHAWHGAGLDRVEPLLGTSLPNAVLAQVPPNEADYRHASRLHPWALVPEGAGTVAGA